MWGLGAFTVKCVGGKWRKEEDYRDDTERCMFQRVLQRLARQHPPSASGVPVTHSDQSERPAELCAPIWNWYPVPLVNPVIVYCIFPEPVPVVLGLSVPEALLRLVKPPTANQVPKPGHGTLLDHYPRPTAQLCGQPSSKFFGFSAMTHKRFFRTATETIRHSYSTPNPALRPASTPHDSATVTGDRARCDSRPPRPELPWVAIGNVLSRKRIFSFRGVPVPGTSR